MITVCVSPAEGEVTGMAKLLLVDDEPAHFALYKRFLAEDGHEIVGARCGEEAITMAKRFCPSVVVLDLVLPDMDGTEAIGRLIRECGGPKIVINTGYERFKYNFKCWGADAFVVKSSDPSELKAKVNQVLGPPAARASRRDKRN
jgi:DNA-binding response OmpR family regulator